MKGKELKPLSLIDILTRNLLLLSVMFIAVGLGIAVQLLDKHSLDCHFLQIQSDRLGFIFFIVVSACYVSLLFIHIKKQWLNFFAQIVIAIILFVLLLFIFNPNLRVDLFLAKSHVEFNTRSWEKVDDLPISEMVSFDWLQLPDKREKFFSMGIVCPSKYSYYWLNFVFAVNYKLPLKKFKKNKFKTGIACNKTTLQLVKEIPSREKALLVGDYQSFLQLDSNMDSKRQREMPLTIPINALPSDLQKKLEQYAKQRNVALSPELINPIVIRHLLEAR